MSGWRASHEGPPFMLAYAVPGLIVMATFAFSLWSSLWKPSGIAVIAWIVGWGVASGRVAVRWTLAGFSALLLAYIGSKVVLELVLGRV